MLFCLEMLSDGSTSAAATWPLLDPTRILSETPSATTNTASSKKNRNMGKKGTKQDVAKTGTVQAAPSNRIKETLGPLNWPAFSVKKDLEVDWLLEDQIALLRVSVLDLSTSSSPSEDSLADANLLRSSGLCLWGRAELPNGERMRVLRLSLFNTISAPQSTCQKG